MDRNKKSLQKSTKIYPTDEGWIILKEKIKNLWCLLPVIFEDNFKHYTDLTDNSFKFAYDYKFVKETFPEFLNTSKYTTKKHIRVESPMQEYLRVMNITMAQFEHQAAMIAWNEYD